MESMNELSCPRYRVILSSSLEVLEQEVNKYMNIGYTPVGGVTVFGPKFGQAIYRETSA